MADQIVKLRDLLVGDHRDLFLDPLANQGWTHLERPCLLSAGARRSLMARNQRSGSHDVSSLQLPDHHNTTSTAPSNPTRCGSSSTGRATPTQPASSSPIRRGVHPLWWHVRLGTSALAYGFHLPERPRPRPGGEHRVSGRQQVGEVRPAQLDRRRAGLARSLARWCIPAAVQKGG